MDYFSTESLRKDLKRKTVRGGFYSAVAQGTITIISLATVPIMARLLNPADFGLVAMVTVFTGFAAMFVDAGLSMATVQRDHITHQQVSNLFWVATALGIAIAALVALLSPAIAWFYREPRLVPITLALSLSFIFSGLTIQHQALLRRAMRFKALAMIQVASFVLPYAIAIAVAWYYRTYWALVVLPIAGSILRFIFTCSVCRWWPSLPCRDVGMRSLVGFGANLTGFSFVNYFARNADNMLIGWWWGDTSLGFYDRGYKLMMAPLTQINAPLANLMIPVLSRLQNEPEKYRKAYFQAISMVQAVACPLMAFVAVTAPWIVDVVFGPGWKEVGPILRWLALAGLLAPLNNSVGWLYISQGRTHDLMRWGLLGCSLIVLSFVLGLPWEAIGVARAYALVICFAIIPLSYAWVGRRGPVTTRDLANLTAQGLAYTIPTVIVSVTIVSQLPNIRPSAGVSLCAFGSIFLYSLTFATTGSGRHNLAELRALLRRAFEPSSEQSRT